MPAFQERARPAFGLSASAKKLEVTERPHRNIAPWSIVAALPRIPLEA